MSRNSPKMSCRRELTVRDESNVLVAGGGPAGVAAAIGVQMNMHSRAIDVKQLQARLKAMGAYPPSFREKKEVW